MKYDIKNDYIMTSEMSKFDNYNRYDLMGIKYDFDQLLNDNEISYKDKLKIADKYDKVIRYIINKISERGE